MFRESLFAPVFKNKITQAPNQNSAGAIRFSTFGYDTAAGPADTTKTLRRQSTNTKDKDKNQQQQLPPPPPPVEMNDFSHHQFTDIPPPPASIITCSKHHHDQNKKNIKMEESRIYVDIRNSAPDVIIMTSH